MTTEQDEVVRAMERAGEQERRELALHDTWERERQDEVDKQKRQADQKRLAEVQSKSQLDSKIQSLMLESLSTFANCHSARSSGVNRNFSVHRKYPKA